MKLLFCLVVVLCVADSFSEPLLGVLGRRSLYGRRCMKGGILGVLLGGECNTQQTIQTRRAPAAAVARTQAPAASPSVNVNVQNVYTNQNNHQETHNNQIGSVNNNVANNKYALDQNIDNRAESNVYNNRRADNKVVNNNYGGYSQPCEGDC